MIALFLFLSHSLSQYLFSLVKLEVIDGDIMKPRVASDSNPPVSTFQVLGTSVCYLAQLLNNLCYTRSSTCCDHES